MSPQAGWSYQLHPFMLVSTRQQDCIQDKSTKQLDGRSWRGYKRIYEMQYHAFTVPIPAEAEEISLEPPANTRLAEIHVPTLLIVGAYDIPDKIELVGQLVTEIPNARQIVIPDAAHIVNMEQPAEFNRVVLDFLAHIPN